MSKSLNKMTLDDNIEQVSIIPKYQQLGDMIKNEIQEGRLKKNDRLPSVNKFSKSLNISRDTVFKALNDLSEQGIIRSENKLGYFVNSTEVKTKIKILFMLDRFTSWKDDMYHSFVETVGDQGHIDVFFHHQNVELFSQLINNNLKNYAYFVVVTYIPELAEVRHILNKIPAKKRLILDSKEGELDGKYAMVYQDFEHDLRNILNSNLNKVNKYNQLLLVSPSMAPHGTPMTVGFNKFLKENDVNGRVVRGIDPTEFQEGNLYITIDAYDQYLVQVIKLTRMNNFKLGNQIGLISYNDTPTKEILDGGITVINTDFKEMGTAAATMILEQEFAHLANPTKLIMRSSF